ncbi:hypothetical protein [Lachnoclostridium sp.]|uniref:hypothetical protein n=1 Tax=Lachnoclostridium sp. TaxID=2028282 RepID=UPI00289FDA44|nr:hypothetical protein [Lachnoclostridium sp.]
MAKDVSDMRITNQKVNSKRLLITGLISIVFVLIMPILIKPKNNQVIRISNLQSTGELINIYIDVLDLIKQKWGEIGDDAKLLNEIIYLDETNAINMGYIRIFDYKKNQIYSVNISKETDETISLCIYVDDSKSNDEELFRDSISLEKNMRMIQYLTEQKNSEKPYESYIIEYYNIGKIPRVNDLNNYVIIDQDSNTDDFYMYLKHQIGTTTDSDKIKHYLLSSN